MSVYYFNLDISVLPYYNTLLIYEGLSYHMCLIEAPPTECKNHNSQKCRIMVTSVEDPASVQGFLLDQFLHHRQHWNQNWVPIARFYIFLLIFISNDLIEHLTFF